MLRVIETYRIGDLRNAAGMLFQQLGSSLEANRTNEVSGPLIDDCTEFPLKLPGADIQLLRKRGNVE